MKHKADALAKGAASSGGGGGGRPQPPSRPSPAAASSPAGSGANTGSSDRPYTPEQEEGAAKIVMLSKKCYYQVCQAAV